MAEDSDTLRVRMLRSSGRNDETQWFEYRPAFNADIVRVSWEHDTMDVELDRGVAEQLVRVGYAAPSPAGPALNPALAAPPEPIPSLAKPQPEKPDTETVETPRLRHRGLRMPVEIQENSI